MREKSEIAEQKGEIERGLRAFDAFVSALGNTIRANCVLLTGIALIVFTLIPGLWTVSFWAERTFDATGQLLESKFDPARIFLLPVGIVALVFTMWRSLAAHRQANAALEQAKVATRQAAIAERGLNVERFEKAAELLNSENAIARRAAIYSLKELAVNDPTHSYVLSIRLLAAFVRHYCERVSLPLLKTPIDIQHALEFVSAIRTEVTEGPQLESRGDMQVNLRAIKLCKIGFWEANLKKAILSDSHFNEIDFMGEFGGATFMGTYFKKVAFTGCDLSSVRFYKSVFEDCRFNNCNLSGAVFLDAKFSNSVIRKANISNCILTKKSLAPQRLKQKNRK